MTKTHWASEAKQDSHPSGGVVCLRYSSGPISIVSRHLPFFNVFFLPPPCEVGQGYYPMVQIAN